MSKLCAICYRSVDNRSPGLECELGCNLWFHSKCSGVSQSYASAVGGAERAPWSCKFCTDNKAHEGASNSALADSSLPPAIAEFMREIRAELGKSNGLRAEISYLKSYLLRVKEENQAREQFLRLNNLEIRNVPFFQGENLLEVLYLISVKINVIVTSCDIDFMTRIANRTTANVYLPKSIILRLTSCEKKEEILKAVKAHGGITTEDVGFVGSVRRVFVSDHLTPRNKELLKMAKQRAKECDFKYTWTKSCKIFVRQTDTSTIMNIEKESDLEKIRKDA